MISERELNEIERHSYMLSEPENQAGQTLRILVNEIYKLQAALGRYGRHSGLCDSLDGYSPCDCGFGKATQ